MLIGIFIAFLLGVFAGMKIEKFIRPAVDPSKDKEPVKVEKPVVV